MLLIGNPEDKLNPPMPQAIQFAMDVALVPFFMEARVKMKAKLSEFYWSLTWMCQWK